MGKIGFRIIAFAVVVGGIWLFGFVTGGSFGSGMSVDRLEPCLPARTVAELGPCTSGGQP